MCPTPGDVMKSLYQEGSKINFNGLKGVVIKVTETYRKNVLVVKIISSNNVPQSLHRKIKGATTIGIFEMPGGTLEFMNVIE